MSKFRHRPEYVAGRERRAVGAGERRAGPRYVPSDARCLLGLGAEGPSRIVGGLLLNLSQDGALVGADEAPGPNQRAWLRLPTAPPEMWVEAVALEVRRAGLGRRASGRFRVRLRFAAPCPWDTFKASVFGPDGRPDPLDAPNRSFF